MRLIHLSDLHLGKRVNDFSMMDDQSYILDKIIDIIDVVNPDGVMIAGDIYDKSSPSKEAIILFDNFLTALHEKKLKVFVISGNHDGSEKIAYGCNLLKLSDTYMSPLYDGNLTVVRTTDEYGPVNIYLFPFVKPQIVNQFISINDNDSDVKVDTYNDAVKYILENTEINTDERNIILAHQLISDAETSDSEDYSIGGIENIDSSLFDKFDYVALGHLHKPQKIGRDTIRYCGSPLKYSFSETMDKSVTVVDIFEKGKTEVTTYSLIPQRDMREIKGKFDDLVSTDFIRQQKTDDYLRVILTDENDIENAVSSLKKIYPNIMKLEYDNTKTRALYEIQAVENENTKKTPAEMFSMLYYRQNGTEINEEQLKILNELIDKIWGDESAAC